MARPTLDFLCASIANALLDDYHVEKPPVPIRDFLQSPPPSLKHDLSLTEALPFGEALWIRAPGGQGGVFVNPALSEPRRRFAMACALFTGLCTSRGGRAAGLPDVPNDELPDQAALFARHLLIPTALLPDGWQSMSAERLAELFVVPVEVAQARLDELRHSRTRGRNGGRHSI